MADISSADGTKPLLSNKLDILTRRFRQNNTNRRKPEKNHLNWKLWDSTIRRCKIKASSGVWTEPLGEWKTQKGKQWTYQYSPSLDRVLALHGQVWIQYTRIHQTRRPRTSAGQFMQKGILTDALPWDICKADVFRINQTKVNLCGYDKGSPVSNQTPSGAKWEDHVHANEQWSVEKIICDHNGQAIAEGIQNGTALAVSDGSFKNERGTAAAIIENEGQESSRIIITNRVLGVLGDHNPYRAEVCGLFGILVCVEAICKCFKVKSGTIRLGL